LSFLLSLKLGFLSKHSVAIADAAIPKAAAVRATKANDDSVVFIVAILLLLIFYILIKENKYKEKKNVY
jgi:uncharacterized integral membrane protein